MKLWVGGDLADFEIIGKARAQGAGQGRSWHITRMFPSRAPEIVAGGSIFWVVKGTLAVRQKVLELEPFLSADGVKRCRIWLDPTPVKVVPTPRRGFQGWRYLKAQDAPPDLPSGASEMPPELRHTLASLGLL